MKVIELKLDPNSNPNELQAVIEPPKQQIEVYKLQSQKFQVSHEANKMKYI